MSTRVLQTLDVQKTDAFEVTGRGDHPAWQQVAPAALTTVEGEEAGRNHATWFKCLWSKDGLYFLIDCTDTRLSATPQPDQGLLYREDVVEVFLQPDESLPVYFEYEISPLNAELALLLPNLEGHFFGWSPWQYEGERRVRHATAIRGGPAEPGAAITGWSAEFFIPFGLLRPLYRTRIRRGTTWRANVYRIDYDKGRPIHLAWQQVGVNFHNPREFAHIRFV